MLSVFETVEPFTLRYLKNVSINLIIYIVFILYRTLFSLKINEKYRFKSKIKLILKTITDQFNHLFYTSVQSAFKNKTKTYD